MTPVTNFYYSKTLPDGAVGISKISTGKVITPADYVDLFNVLASDGQLGPGALDAQAWPVEAHYFPEVALGAPLAVNNNIPVTGQSYEYKVKNQFVEVTTKWDAAGDYFYYHELPTGITQVTVLDANQQPVSGLFLVESGKLYHSLDSGIYWVRYFINNQFQEDLVISNPVMERGPVKRGAAPCVQPGFFGWTHAVIDLPSWSEYHIRFTDDNRYQILLPYTSLPNDPWYPRVRFNVNPMPPEWSRMNFAPYRPYMVATWVPGKLVAPGVIEFERKRILFDGSKYPDVLVFDKDLNCKYALDGNPSSSPETNGYLYPWAKSRFAACDPVNGRVQVLAEIADDDVIYGFFFYEELDLIYTALDINPFTNPDIRNRVVELVYHQSDSNPERSIWHRVYDSAGNIIPELSSEPTGGTSYSIGRLVVGGSVSLGDYTVQDVRVRGGGLKDEYSTLPETRNLWDLGYWDGKPYPLKGGLVVYLPAELLQKFSSDFITSTVQSIVPMGILPIIRYYTIDGEDQANA